MKRRKAKKYDPTQVPLQEAAGLRCRQPDRDVPELVCDWPLPCPWHTVTIDTTAHPPELRMPLTAERAIRPKMRKILKEIGQTIAEEGEVLQ